MIYNSETKKYTMEIKDILSMFEKIPFIIEEFEEGTDKEKEYGKAIGTAFSPLLSEEIMVEKEKSSILEATLKIIPYFSHSSFQYKETTDPGDLNVPRSMKNEFWGTLFRDAFGTEENSIINSIHNKLRYAYLSEEHILNRGLFKKVMEHKDIKADYSLVLKEDASEENSLDNMISEKLVSIYSLLDYSPAQSGMIDDWISSLYLSGHLDYEMKKREENLFKIQDMKAELLRRKFAGSVSLYNILLSSINRKGTFAPTVPLFSVSGDDVFKDNRLIRALDMPGITTTKIGGIFIDPISVYTSLVPARIVNSLYYSSYGYDAENFEKEPHSFLRYNKSLFSWDNLNGILDSTLIKKIYPRLDSIVGSSPIALDTLNPGEDNEFFLLDKDTSMFDLSLVTNSFFDIQADTLLFHENSLQKELRQNYPYVTYTLSGGNSLSMMDFPWLNYVETSLEKKTKVQEDVDIGVQVSRLVVDPDNSVKENYAVITFSEEFNPNFVEQEESFNPSHNYAYLWSVGLTYNASTFLLEDTKSKALITYIHLKQDKEKVSFEDRESLRNHPSYKVFTEFSAGLVPFAYQGLETDDIFNMKMFYGYDNEGNPTIIDEFFNEEYNKALFLFTPHENVAIAKKYLKQHPDTLLDEEISPGVKAWYSKPDLDSALKHLIYGLSRYNETTGLTEWFWSEPIRVYPKEIISMEEYYPDWMGLVAYINPYLNVTEQCSSPLRQKKAIPRALRPSTLENTDPEIEIEGDEGLYGPSTKAALMNITLDRGYSVYANNSPENTNPAENPAHLRGTYLHRELNTNPGNLDVDAFIAQETIQIWGDNRRLWPDGSGGISDYALDPADDWDSETLIRSKWATDHLGVPAILFKKGEEYQKGIQHSTYFDFRPEKDNSDTSTWGQWVWNDLRTSGMSAAIDLAISVEDNEEAPEDYYLLNRKGNPTEDINAEFDFYVEFDGGNIPSLVMNVYPDGDVLGGNVFTCRLEDVSYIKNKQSQIACSYKVKNTAEGLKIEQTVVADRYWKTIYRLVERDGSNPNKYYIYEKEDEDFSEEDPALEIPKFDVEFPPPYENPSDNEDYFFGHLIKYKGDSNNSLEGINLFNRDFGFNPTIGTLYDVRLYNRGMSKIEAVVMCAGTRKELYSYSPSLYKLINQFYEDPGILRRHLKPLEGRNIDRVRVFSRGVWDSIVTDLHPLTDEDKNETSETYREGYQDPLWDFDIYDREEKLKPGVIEQKLLNIYETGFDVKFDAGTSIYYKGKRIDLTSGDYSYVQTSLYPTSYRNQRFNSGIKLRRNESRTGLGEGEYSYEAYVDTSINEEVPQGSSRLSLPSSPAGESLVYKADLSLNLIVDDTIDFGAPFIKGPKIRTALKGDRMALSHKAGNIARNTQDNFAILPFYVPDQSGNIVGVWHPKIFGMRMNNLVLSSGLGVFLNATSYYDELQTPIPYITDEGEYKFTSRWHGIRVLKEGEYYFTVKYPFQILPLKNSGTNKSRRYPVFYLTSRFKVVVTGEAKHYYEGEVPNNPNWLGENLKSHFEHSAGSENNKDFSHREIKIDLYSIYSPSGSPSSNQWAWRKIASNYDSSDEDILLLDKGALDKPLILKKSVDMYFSSSYQTPFFDLEGEMDYLGMAVEYSKENLTTSKITNKDSVITLQQGNSYRMLFDYTSKLSELSFSEEYTGNSDINPNEVEGYNYNTINLLSSEGSENNIKNFAEVAYENIENWSQHIGNDFDLNSTSTGFYVEGNGEFKSIDQEYLENDLALGNPYSNSSERNLMYSKMLGKNIRREDIEDLAYFPYRVEDVEANEIVAPRPYNRQNPLKVMVSEGARGSFDIMSSNDPVDEYSSIKNIHKGIVTRIKSALYELKNRPSGLFNSINTASPIVTDSYSSEERARELTHDFISYDLKSFSVVPYSGLSSFRNLPLKGNRIVPSYFDNPNFTGEGDYEYDDETGDDKWTLYLGTESSYEMAYSSNIKLPLYSKCRVRLKSPEEDVEVNLRYSVEGIDYFSDSELVEQSSEFVDVIFDIGIKEETNKIILEFKEPGGGNLQNQKIVLDKFELRMMEEKKYSMGLSSLYLPGATVTGSSPISIPSFPVIAFRRKDKGGIFPIQVFNAKKEISSENSTSATVNFIANNKLRARVRGDVTPLFKPWVERLNYRQDDEEATSLYPYTLEKEDKGNNLIPKKDSNPSIEGVFKITPTSLKFSPPTSLNVGGDDSPGIIFNSNVFEEKYKMALRVDTTEPFTMANERFSMVSNCINYERFKKGISSPVAITNIQLLSDGDPGASSTVVYELEYFPIIYDELKNHFSLNFLIRDN